MKSAASSLILASASPRRRELLEALGIEFGLQAADIDESVLPDESPTTYAVRLASEKAEHVAKTFPSSIVLGADTIVVLNDGGTERILGKPTDDADACSMLRALSGREHDVYTAYSIRAPGLKKDNIVRTAVRFQSITDEEIRRYVNTGEPKDKAGAYAIQGNGGMFVRSINGSYSNVVGLPVAEVYDDLKALGLLAKLLKKDTP